MSGVAPNAASAAELFKANLKSRKIESRWIDAAGIFEIDDASSVYRDFRPLAAAVIPYFDISGEPVAFERDGEERHFCRVRYLEDPPRSFVKSKPQRYAQPAQSGTHAYFPTVPDMDWREIASDQNEYLIITEGEFKSLVASGHGFPTIGLGGVFNFLREGALLPEFDAIAWKKRLVFVIFDSDAATNANVQAAERRLCAELVKRGADVCPVRLPTIEGMDKTGLDDFLTARGAEALTELLNSAQAADPGKALVVEGTDVEIADSVLFDLGTEHLSQVVFCDGKFYVYRDTCWHALSEPELANAIYRYDKLRLRTGTKGGGGVLKLTETRVKSARSIMQNRASDPSFFIDAPPGINCANGFIAFDEAGTPSLEPHDRDHRQRHTLPGRWEPGASWQRAGLLTKFFTGCFGQDDDFDDRVLLTGELCGVAALDMATRLKAPKATVLFGPTAENGKSELIAMLTGLLPPEAVSAIPPTRFSDEKMVVNLAGRKLNAVSELGTTRAISSDIFKSVITGDEITGRDLYRSAVFFRPSALHVYATNTLPPFYGGFDRGVQRRLLVLLFNRSIPRNEAVANIGSRIAAEEADALLTFAVEGAARVIRTGRFTEPPSSRNALVEWICSADPVIAWFTMRTEYKPGHEVPTKAAFADFVGWAEENGFRKDRLPESNNFVGRLRAQDARIGRRRTGKNQYLLVSLKILPEKRLSS